MSDKPTEIDRQDVVDPKDLVRRGLRILEMQIQQLEKETKKGDVLSPRVAKTLIDYIKTSVQVYREIKDLGEFSGDELKNMTPEKIRELAKRATEELGIKF